MSNERESSSIIGEVVNGAVVLLFAVGYGTRALVDLDLGWHLAGGFWMLDHGMVPYRDFLGIDGAPWVAYSWFPEVVQAALVRWGGFSALRSLQLVLIALSAFVTYGALRKAAIRNTAPVGGGDVSSFRPLLIAILAFLLSMQFLAPLWYLRPQLVSIILFTLLLARAEEKKLSFATTFPLAVLWANVHILWVAVPGIVMLYSLFEASALRRRGMFLGIVLCGAGLCTPYGIRQYEVLFDYAFRHREAYFLIKEFQPLMPEFGYLFWLFAATGLGTALVFRGMLERGRSPLAILFVALFLIAASQRKYLPFFGITAGFVAASEFFPRWVRERSLSGESRARKEASRGLRAAAGAMVVLLTGGALLLFPAERALLPFQQELLRLAQQFQRDPRFREYAPGAGEIPVLNYFDDGGWIGYALYRGRPPGQTESRFKTTIDGRTLVMGEVRLRAFRELITGTKNVCPTIERWKTRVAILPRSSPIGELILKKESRRPEHACLDTWVVLLDSPAWILAAVSAG